MADRGRDLKVSILSDAERFDLAHPAEQLADVADAAKDAGTALDKMSGDVQDSGRKLDALGKDGKSAGTDLDTLGKDAKTAASKVDSSFDAIARSSKQKLGGGMEEGAHKAKGALKDVGAEAGSTARESAASFDGTANSVGDAFQEVAANALSSFGVLGAGIGLAAAAGFGMLRAQAEKTKAAISDLVGALVDQGGKLDRANVLDQLKAFAQDGTLVDLKRQAQDAKIPVNDFLLAMAGDPASMARTTDAINTQRDAINQAMDMASGGDPALILEATKGLDDLAKTLIPVTENYATASEAAAVYADAASKTSVISLDAAAAAAQVAADAAKAAAETRTLASATTAFSDTLAGFSDPLDAYTDKLSEKEDAEQKTAEKTASATESQTDSWSDYAKSVSVSVGEYLTELDKQVKAQEDWEKNMTALAGKVSEGTLAELARMGPEGAPLVAAFAKATDAELAHLDKSYARRAKSGVDGFVAALTEGKEPAKAAGSGIGEATGAGYAMGIRNHAGPVADAARGVRDAAAGALADPIHARIVLDTDRFYTDLGAAQRSMAERMRP